MWNFNVSRELEAGADWLAAYFLNSGAKRLVMGLSGGLDSATVALWAAQAVGEENLLLVAMPYGLYVPGNMKPILSVSNAYSVVHAEHVHARIPKAGFTVADIAFTVDAEITHGGYPVGASTHLAFANMKARARALRLRTLANIHGGLVLGTENKTENLLGYFTIGGDEETDIEMLSNYYKTEVRMLAQALGVPESIISKAPSADLWTGQTDEGELGFTYAEADLVLSHLAKKMYLVPQGVSAEIADAVEARRNATHFKRRPRPTFSRRTSVFLADF